jgi:uncharacterized protein (TIGR02996 family)
VTTEDDFHALLAEHPDDHSTRLILADWLDDRGDPRGPGYRALAMHRRTPVRSGTPGKFTYPGYCTTQGAMIVFGDEALAEAGFAALPDDWLAATQNYLGPADPLGESEWACAATPRAAEDAAAGAFAELPAARQTELLAAPE